MKRNLRFYIALFASKATYRVMRILRKQATNVPGMVAVRICPNFLEKIKKPEKIIGITGTNGKTTVSNMIEDVLDKCGYIYTCNRMGGNIENGIVSMLIRNSSFLGKPKNDLAVFEIDERSAPILFPYMNLHTLVCTNLFRDSYGRNAHTEYIAGLLENSISDETKLILCGDDLITSSLKKNNERLFFGIQKQDNETNESKNIVCDIRTCPVCGETLAWDFIRYHHIGQASCPACGFSNPPLDFVITEINKEDNSFNLLYNGETHKYPIVNSNLINIYNSLAAVSMLLDFGIKPETIAEKMSDVKINKLRYDEDKVGETEIVMHLAKGKNPVACSRAFENAKNHPGNKAVFLYIDDYYDATYSVENIAWFYDADFEFLNDDSISQLIISGARHHDIYVRMLIAGVPKEKMIHYEKPEDAIMHLNPSYIDCLFLIYDLFNLSAANRVKELAKEIILNKSKETEQ